MNNDKKFLALIILIACLFFALGYWFSETFKQCLCFMPSDTYELWGFN